MHTKAIARLHGLKGDASIVLVDSNKLISEELFKNIFQPFEKKTDNARTIIISQIIKFEFGFSLVVE